MPKSPSQVAPSRRALLGYGAIPLVGGGHRRPDFDRWWAEHERVGALLERTPEVEEGARNLLLDRLCELEALIVNTASSAPSAARAKARILLWLMEMEQHDGVAAMRDIHSFILRTT